MCLGTQNLTGPITFGDIFEKLIKGNSVSNFQSVCFQPDDRYSMYDTASKLYGLKPRSTLLSTLLDSFEIDFIP